LRTSDIRGVAKLATETTIAINRMSEGVHQSVLGTLGISRGGVPGKTRGITGLVYKSIYGVTQLVANSIDKALLLLQPLFERVEEEMPGTSEREAVLAILNGVMGDRLVATGNPLATPMTLRYRDKALDSSSITPTPNPTSKVVVLVHGLCLSDLQWRFVKHDEGQEHAQSVDLGETLATELGYTPVYVRYNTGLHTSQNGRELANQLEQMVAHWPAPIEELTLIGYSMGGLVARSACHYGKKSAMRWHGHLQNIVFLATPHHGAPLERAGNWLDAILGSTPYSAPYAKLLQLRSAGITDLRYGHVLDEDWQGHDRFRRKPDSRQLVPLPAGVNCYTVAATTASRRSALADRWIGDGLVPLHSALGQHDDARRVLGFAKSAQWIGYNTNHMDVPGRPEVMRKVLEWLTPAVSE
jgi:pimeloyl-ACP methyl ester carboxylesterase